jgi:hypothetical protein
MFDKIRPISTSAESNECIEFDYSEFNESAIRDYQGMIKSHAKQYVIQFRVEQRTYVLSLSRLIKLWGAYKLIARCLSHNTQVLTKKYSWCVRKLFPRRADWDEITYSKIFEHKLTDPFFNVNLHAPETAAFSEFINTWCPDMVCIARRSREIFHSPSACNYSLIKIRVPLKLTTIEFHDRFAPTKDNPKYGPVVYLKLALMLRAALFNPSPETYFIYTPYTPALEKKNYAYFTEAVARPWKFFACHTNLLVPTNDSELEFVREFLRTPRTPAVDRFATRADIIKFVNVYRKQNAFPLYRNLDNAYALYDKIAEIYGMRNKNTFNAAVKSTGLKLLRTPTTSRPLARPLPVANSNRSRNRIPSTVKIIHL